MRLNARLCLAFPLIFSACSSYHPPPFPDQPQTEAQPQAPVEAPLQNTAAPVQPSAHARLAPDTPKPAGGGAKAKASPKASAGKRVVFLHHSVGQNVWEGGVPKAYKALRPQDHLKAVLFPVTDCPEWSNRPQDYHRFWVAGQSDCSPGGGFKGLLANYDVIVLKHCYTHDLMLDSEQKGDPNSRRQTLADYKAAYQGLKKLFHKHPDKTFIVWTVAPALEQRYKKFGPEFYRQVNTQGHVFADWVRERWDEKGDNVFVFDFRQLAAGKPNGFLKPEYAQSSDPRKPDSHLNARFSREVAPLFANRIAQVVNGQGDSTPSTGK